MLLSKKLAFILIFITGVVLRLYNINFGLPHSFYADEPEISEFAIKYTYELKDIISNNNYYKLIPLSYVYGTFPTYALTIATMGFSKFNNLAGIPFDKTSIFIFLRVLNALVSSIIIIVGYKLYDKMFRDKKGALLTAGLLALNWKLIVHSHYVNQDTFLVMLTFLSIYFLYIASEKRTDTYGTLLSGILFGLAVGTKITALITIPLYIYVFISKKMYRNLAAFCFVTFGAYIASNPFSIIYINDFLYRVYEMLTKEGGLVFDSVDTTYLKYMFGISYMLTPMIFTLSLYGIYSFYFKREAKVFNTFLIGNIIIYLIFFSLQNRRVDRWLLPLLPISIIYASYAIMHISKAIKSRLILGTLFSALLLVYAYYPGLLLVQFQNDTPKSAAYKWAQTNLPPESNKLVYTEEGLDPFNKLPGTRVIKFNVYEAENAQFFIPQDPVGYDYIIISSRTMDNFKKPEIMSKFPFYYERWNNFEQKIMDRDNFTVVKDFTLTKPNLIPLSDVVIYKNLHPID